MTYVSVIDPQTIRFFSSLLPDWMSPDIVSGRCLGFAGIVEEEAAGVLVCRLEGAGMGIPWLFVHPAYRRKKVGTALMEELLDRCIRFGRIKTVFCEYGGALEKEEREGVRQFLESFVFRTQVVDTGVYEFPLARTQLPARAFGTSAMKKRERGIRELSSLSAGERLLAARHLTRRGFLLQEGQGVDWDRYDGKLSFFWMREKRLLGILLAEREDKFVYLTDLYVEPEVSKIAILMLAEFVDRVKHYCEKPGNIRVMAVTEESERLLGRLVPEAVRRTAYRSEFKVE